MFIFLGFLIKIALVELNCYFFVYDICLIVYINLTRFGRSSACKYFFAFLFTDVSGSQDGSIRMWEFGHAQEITSHHTSGSYQRVTRARFSPQGNKAS